jgi:hypothetical protein
MKSDTRRVLMTPVLDLTILRYSTTERENSLL